MWGFALLSLAYAGPQPMVALQGYGSGDRVSLAGQTEWVGGAGGGVAVGVRAVGPLFVELAVEGGGRGASWLDPYGAWRVGFLPGLRVYVTPHDGPIGALSVSLLGGGEVREGIGEGTTVGPLGQAGLALDLFVPKSGDWAVRLGADVQLREEGAPGSRATLGVVWSPRPKPEPPPEAPTGVWLSYPRCAWVGLDDARAYLSAYDAAAEADPSGGGLEGEAPAEPPGLLWVVASPGDVVAVQGEVLGTAGPDGIVPLAASTQVDQLSVVGGGRVVARPVPVASGYATWVRVRPPPEVRVVFALDSDVIVEGERDRLRELAERTGAWSWRLHGSWSPEGAVEKNEVLARSRAEAVRNALVAAGLPIGRVVVGPPEAPDPALAPEQQRAVRLVPVPAGEAP